MPVSPPKHLDTAGRKLWQSITEKYELRPDELGLLEQACAGADMVAELEQARRDEGLPLTTTGSMGQQVIHPYIGELRAQRSQVAALLAKLKLPDESTAKASSDASSAARKAAQSRWSRGA